jgi:hypothetical protein
MLYVLLSHLLLSYICNLETLWYNQGKEMLLPDYSSVKLLHTQISLNNPRRSAWNKWAALRVCIHTIFNIKTSISNVFHQGFSQWTCLSPCVLEPVAFYIPIMVVNKYPGSGAIRLKTNVPSPNTFFMVQPGSSLTKIIGLTSGRPVSFSAFTILDNKKLLINGTPVLVITPYQDSEKPYILLYVTDPEGL